MCLLKEMDFRTVNGFKSNQWTNLFLGMDEECIAALEFGRFQLYFDVVGHGSIRKDSRRWDFQAIQMSPDLLDKIEETNAMEMENALEHLYGYRWEEQVAVKPTFMVNMSNIKGSITVESDYLKWDENYIHSAVWLKFEAIKLLKEHANEHIKTWGFATESEQAEVQELNEIQGLAYTLEKGLSKERIERKIQLALEREDDLLNHLKYVECDSDGHFLTVVWQSDNELVHNRMKTLMAQWAE